MRVILRYAFLCAMFFVFGAIARSVFLRSQCGAKSTAAAAGPISTALVVDSSPPTTATPTAAPTTAAPSPAPGPALPSYAWLSTKEGQDTIAELEALVKAPGEDGPVRALRRVKELSETNDAVLNACHPLIHRVGRAAMTRAGKGVPFAFAGTVPFTPDAAARLGAADGYAPAKEVTEANTSLLFVCNAAFLHGVTEHFFVEQKDATSLNKAVDAVRDVVCGSFSNREWRSTWECRHGIGHGIAQWYRRDAQARVLANAVAACKAHGSALASTCMNGVWMDHWASTRVSGGADLDLDPAGALAVCSSAPARPMTSTCALYAPTAYLLHHPRDYAGAMPVTSLQRALL